VKPRVTLDRVTESETTLERIKHLERQLASATVNSFQHRQLNAAIQIEANLYRKSLDTEQATAIHDAEPPLTSRPGSWRATFLSRRPALGRRIRSRSHAAPRR
jgi:hypothetical protein